jgi:tyrosyl-tRNA synthetase
LIRRKLGGEAYALTCPLITRADGGKFGKSEAGNVWLDPKKTSPYQFYQFWLNTSDADAGEYIRKFTLLDRGVIEELERQHAEAPHLRILQKALAEEITVRVHSQEDLQSALDASEILFGKGTTEKLMSLPEDTLLAVFDGVPQSELAMGEIEGTLNVVEFLSEHTGVMGSKSEARRMLKEGCILINKAKVDDQASIGPHHLINGKYILVQKGKKNYHLVKVV